MADQFRARHRGMYLLFSGRNIANRLGPGIYLLLSRAHDQFNAV